MRTGGQFHIQGASGPDYVKSQIHTDVINLLFTANREYRFYLAVALHSILQGLPPGVGACVHVMERGWTDDDKKSIDRLVSQRRSSQIDFYSVNPTYFSGLPLLPHISLDAYSRILAPAILPCSDFVYFDCDVLCVSGDFIPQTVKHAQPIAAVFHRNCIMGDEFVERWKLEEPNDYFNSGVLWIDADQWRRESASERMLEWMHENTDRLVYGDQDTLNHYFRGRTGVLALEWNLEERHFFERDCGFCLEPDVLRALSHPGIIHYTGIEKPWRHTRKVRFMKIWQKRAHEVAAVTGWSPPCVLGLGRIRPTASYFARCARARLGSLLRRAQ